MTIDPGEAGALLKSVAGAEKRTREFLVYARAGDYMILWGVLWAIGYSCETWAWQYSHTLWLTLDAIGLAGTSLITWRASRALRPDVSHFLFLRPLLAACVLFGFGTLWIWLARFGVREQAAFWPTFCGVLLFVFGLWAGRTLCIAAALIVALTLAGYFGVGVWFDLWLAVTCGGALILGGIWLRR
ncbi:MAG TPA: hypothetical protein VNU97_10045 [Rhizomicrobium sp.]|jgi:hypothetical protein|nr:hypothetical protein [Rhizomicrobium sp.]